MLPLWCPQQIAVIILVGYNSHQKVSLVTRGQIESNHFTYLHSVYCFLTRTNSGSIKSCSTIQDTLAVISGATLQRHPLKNEAYNNIHVHILQYNLHFGVALAFSLV